MGEELVKAERGPIAQRIPLTGPNAPVLVDPRGNPLAGEVLHEPSRIYGAEDPLDPAIPEGAPRQFDSVFGYNTAFAPRFHPGQNLTPFQQLRALGRYDMVRLAIGDVKGQILGMEWQVRTTKEFRGKEESFKAELDIAKAWMKKPDPLADRRFRAFVSMALEDILVTDALTMYVRRNLDGEAIGLELVNGATIKPLIDDRGRPPTPPHAAFQQIVYGRPETEFEIGQLWYLPRNPQPDSPYGMSPVEQVIITINLALRAQMFDLSFFVSGNIPDAILMMPKEWTDEQIRQYQRYFDRMLSGRTDRRPGGVRMVPGGEGAKFIPTKQRDWSYPFFEYLARVISWSFQVSPAPIAKMMNVATAKALEESTLESGVRPVAGFIGEAVFTRFVQEELGFEMLEVGPGAEEQEDAAAITNRSQVFVPLGIWSRNEARKKVGDDPIEGGDVHIVTDTAGKHTLVKDLPELAALSAERSKKMPTNPFGGGGDNGEARTEGSEDEGEGGGEAEGSSEGEEGEEARDSSGKGKGTRSSVRTSSSEDGDQLERDLKTWQKVAISRLRKGKPAFREFVSEAIPETLSDWIGSSLQEATTEDEVRMVFDRPLRARKWAKRHLLESRESSPSRGSPGASGAGNGSKPASAAS